MGIQVAIKHNTGYHYDRPVTLSPQVIRLRPAPHTRNPIRGYSLNIFPENHFINWQQDPFGNYQARIVFPEKVTSFEIAVEVIVDMVTINPFDFFLEEYAEKVPFTYEPQLAKELSPYLEVTESGPLLLDQVAKAREGQPASTVDYLVHINQLINQAISYSIRMEPGVQTCEETLDRAIGSCRDSAWVLVQLFRHLGLAARFVSGYLVQLVADQKPLEGPKGPKEDFTDLHAWAEVYLPGAGWVGLDATSGLLAGEGHIPLACTPDPISAAPVSGMTEPCRVSFSYSNSVDRIWEKPRVTKPYTAAAWNAIHQLGEKVDGLLEKGDVRLTMGGEPTFVSAEDMESAQWNEAADGEDKRRQAFQLAMKLKEHFGPEGFMHMGQGKWYPGEPLPRWQYALYWRKDGLPTWTDPDLWADPQIDYKLDSGVAETFLQKLAHYLGVSPKNIKPAYEDAFYFLWESGNLPVNIDPLNIPSGGKPERKKLAALLDQGLGVPVGYVLPLQWDHPQKTWASCFWDFSREQLFLVPGDSAIGLRLPLDRLPYMSPKQEAVLREESPLNQSEALADLEAVHAHIGKRAGGQHEPASPHPTTDDFQPTHFIQTIKTALSAEVRQGALYIFLPPIETMDMFLDLLASIEKVSKEMETPIILEGYQPPHDSRMTKLVVAPDPGVIEVNIHPASSWKEISENYDMLFELARNCKLGAEKFMIDGKHTGTGGGNHITLGGKSPVESPFLRRPDLLRSFVNFWQNHPGLSYLFSSAFVGPTSQSPRVDEGRQSALYELEIAFRELERQHNPPPWIVDRLFRNLLIDLTGNTHRAEFCIDKMYSPDSQSGRLGILEMRGFDMPPHKELCLTQLLLIRALTAVFWKQPYKKKLVRWGPALHDKFLIYHFVKEDLKEVVTYIQEHGVDFQLSWLEPFFEFRFPMLGKISLGEVKLGIRAGIEPWNVLGEEMSSSGTARFVDSSVERIEVTVEGLQPDRYQLLCNQTNVPLTETGTSGRYIAAIRYKAWNPPSALHPTIGADVPLVFDVYDSWNNRSIGGCTYHVSHPGGRNYDTFPVNSFEAEARRSNRFWEYNHTPKAVEQIKTQASPVTESLRYVSTAYEAVENVSIKQMEPDAEYPYTLDLRKV
ncbi:MAG: transglutaminase family protein [Bacteroidota bacterium]